ncbi:unnamed protein product [Ectocarpus sp. 4 AP-2014]
MNIAGRLHCLVLPSTGCAYWFECDQPSPAATCYGRLCCTAPQFSLVSRRPYFREPTVARLHGVFKNQNVIHLPRVTSPPNISWPSDSWHMQLHTSMLRGHCFSFRHSRRPFHTSILCSLTLRNRLHVFLRVADSTLLTTPTNGRLPCSLYIVLTLSQTITPPSASLRPPAPLEAGGPIPNPKYMSS